MQECHYDEKMTKAMILVELEFLSARMSLWWKNDQGYDTSGIRVCKCKNVIMKFFFTNIMIQVGLEFVSARMSLWWKNDQGYDTSDIRVCKCKNVIMMKKWSRLWY